MNVLWVLWYVEIMVPKYSRPKPHNLGMLPCMTKVTVDFIKDFEMERLSWIITALFIRERKREIWLERQRWYDRAERFEDAKLLALTMKEWAPKPVSARSAILEAGKGKEADSPLGPPEGIQVCWHLILAQWEPSGDFGPQNYKIIKSVLF